MSQTAITLAFEQHLANLQMGGQPVIPDEFVLAYLPGLNLSAPIDRAAGLPAAGQIVHRQPVDQRGKVNANGVAYSIIMDTRIGDFTFNAMYLVHKASGLVAMVVHKAAEDKLKNQTNRPGNSLVKSMLMEYQGAAEATNTQVNADTWQIDFSARLLGLDRDIQQQAHDHYGDAAFIADGFAVRPGQGVNEFIVAAGLGYIAGLRTELTAEQSINVNQRPATLYADVYHAGTLLSDWHTQVTIRASSSPLTDYTDEAGYPHYVVPLASLAANGAVTDQRGRGGLWWHEQGPQAHTKEQVGLDKLENWSWSHSYTDTTGGATKYASGKAVADAYNALNNSKLNASSYTAADVLAKLKTVDGTGSGLDADLLDGQHGSYYRAWVNLTGVPATASRWPDFAEVTGKPATYPPSSHTHDDRYYTKAQGDGRYAGIARDIKNATALGTSALNTITEPGFYYQSANANASTAGNYPVLLAGTLIVTMAAGVVQTYIPYGTPGIIYTRGYYGSSWSGWAATYSTANKPSSADVGLSNLQNWSYSHSYTDATGGATRYASGKAVADAYNALNSSKLNAASYTAADVLAKVKSVDGTGSGLDAELLDGQHGAYYRTWANLTGVPATFPPSSHAHTWASITGKPGTFPPSSHSHPWSEITGKPAAYPPASHGHSWNEITDTPTVLINSGANANGKYRIWSDGSAEQFGIVSLPAATNKVVWFPISFSAICDIALVTGDSTSGYEAEVCVVLRGQASIHIRSDAAHSEVSWYVRGTV